MTTTYLKPTERREQLLDAALTLATRHGYMNITRDLVGAAAGVAPSLINRYFKDMAGLKNQVIREAVRRKCLLVIGQAVVNKHPGVRAVSCAIKDQAVAALRK